MIALMKAVEERMPYVETVNIFRMFDNADTDWAAHGNVSRFGFFADPNPDRAYMDSYGTRQMIVLDRGEAVGTGTHDELMKTCPVYREIAESQLSASELR